MTMRGPFDDGIFLSVTTVGRNPYGFGQSCGRDLVYYFPFFAHLATSLAIPHNFEVYSRKFDDYC